MDAKKHRKGRKEKLTTQPEFDRILRLRSKQYARGYHEISNERMHA
jgi:hypothetical protein